MSDRRVVKVSGLIFAVTLVAGCASGEMDAEPTPAPEAEAAMAEPSPEMVAEGAQVFAGAGRCEVCHGQGGAGGRFGPDLSDDEWIWVDPASPTAMQEVAELIRTGITEPRASDAGMPPMGGGNLSDAQLEALSAYILSL